MTREERFRKVVEVAVQSLGLADFRRFAEEIDNDVDNDFWDAVQQKASQLFPEDFLNPGEETKRVKIRK